MHGGIEQDSVIVVIDVAGLSCADLGQVLDEGLTSLVYGQVGELWSSTSRTLSRPTDYCSPRAIRSVPGGAHVGGRDRESDCGTPRALGDGRGVFLELEGTPGPGVSNYGVLHGAGRIFTNKLTQSQGNVVERTRSLRRTSATNSLPIFVWNCATTAASASVVPVLVQKR